VESAELWTMSILIFSDMENSNELKTAGSQKYVNILSNSGFKALFGDVNNKDVVISIMNVLLPEHRKVTDIEYMPTEHQGPIHDISKGFYFDYMCRDSSGAIFIVELQCYKESDWFKRCVSYACRSYDRQNRKGENYDVPPVYLIGLMNIEVNHPDKEFWKDRYFSEYTFREKESHDLLDETIVIIFAEMANFNKPFEECETDRDKMLYLLKNISSMESQPEWLQDETYSRLFKACKVAEFSEDKLIQYQKDMYDERRFRGEMDAAFNEGVEKGIEKGIVKGVEKGIEQNKLETAKNLKNLGVAVEVIAQATGLPAEEVAKL
jgi:predicted transposase/invertase (TIGR01784 family)